MKYITEFVSIFFIKRAIISKNVMLGRMIHFVACVECNCILKCSYHSNQTGFQDKFLACRFKVYANNRNFNLVGLLS